MTDGDFIDHLVNCFGNEHFHADDVIAVLHEAIIRLQSENKNTGSLIAVVNILPEIEQECKRRY